MVAPLPGTLCATAPVDISDASALLWQPAATSPVQVPVISGGRGFAEQEQGWGHGYGWSEFSSDWRLHLGTVLGTAVNPEPLYFPVLCSGISAAGEGGGPKV